MEEAVAVVDAEVDTEVDAVDRLLALVIILAGPPVLST